ncbi:MAG: peroxide stress protein YaaA [Hoylesella buccalis]
MDAATMTTEQLLFAERYLWITSFLYGLLRPLNGIKSYRLEGNRAAARIRQPNDV